MSKSMTKLAIDNINEQVHYDQDTDGFDEIEETYEPKYKDFTFDSGRFIPNTSGKAVKKLKPGSYSLHFEPQRGLFWFEKMKIATDNILDLPSPEYEQVIREMNFFIKPEVRQQFNDMGFIYKRSALLHGLPGTGKTVISNRVARDIIKVGGIVLWVTNPNLLAMAFDVLNDIQPDTLTCAILEEFDTMAQKSAYESMLLTMLDGQVQKENVVYLATTNYLEKIPKRMYRPGRFSSVIKVNFPNVQARQLYLSTKLGNDFPDLQMWVERTSGLSVDEMKEMVQAVYILKNSFEDVLTRLHETREFKAEEPVVTTRPDIFKHMADTMFESSLFALQTPQSKK